MSRRREPGIGLLLVADDATFREATAAALERRGFAVTHVDHARALELLAGAVERAPRLLVVDDDADFRGATSTALEPESE